MTPLLPYRLRIPELLAAVVHSTTGGRRIVALHVVVVRRRAGARRGGAEEPRSGVGGGTGPGNRAAAAAGEPARTHAARAGAAIRCRHLSAAGNTPSVLHVETVRHEQARQPRVVRRMALGAGVGMS